MRGRRTAAAAAVAAAAMVGPGFLRASEDPAQDKSSPTLTTEQFTAVARRDAQLSSAYAESFGFVDVTTTARRREERALVAPLSVTALSMSEREDIDLRRIDDLADLVPNLRFDASFDTSSAARVHLRGVGNGDSVASDDPGVGIYLDGVYLARAQASLHSVFDVERIEVLRGPQGTLFGKNTVGGAVLLTSKRPDFDRVGAEASVRLGNYRRFDTRLAVNVPLSERAAMRLSLATATRDGFTSNKGTGSDLDDDKLLAFRGQLRLLPSENTELLLAADHSLEDRKPQGLKCKVSNPFSVGQDARTRPDLAATGTEFRSAPIAAGLAQQIGVRGTARQLANLTSATNPFLAACAQDDARDERSVASDLSFAQEDLKTFGTRATFSWDLGPDRTLRSITAWRRQELDQARDFDGTSFSFVNLDAVDAGREQQDQISQEIQLSGTLADGRLSYVTGLFYIREKVTDRGYRGLGLGQSFIAPAVPGDLSTLTSLPATFESTTLNVNNQSLAVFGQGTWAVTDRLDATLGLRVTRERKRIKRADVCQGTGLDVAKLCTAAGQVVFAFEGSTRFKDVSPAATLDYALDDSTHLYATWSRGFKSGGFNGRADTLSHTNVVDDEKLTSYEVGFKSLFFDDRLRIDGSVFYSIHSDIQQPIPRSNRDGSVIEVFVTNVGRADIKGAELEVKAVPLEGLNLTSTLGVVNARYVDFDTPTQVGDPRIPDDPEDRLLPNTPSYTMNFGATYRVPLGDLGILRTHLDWTHIGRSGTDVNDSRLLRKGKHGELDARLTWSLPDGATEVVLFGDNLLDREYVVNGIDLGASFGHALRAYNEPRTWGLELRREF